MSNSHDDAIAHEAGHDRSNPSGIPAEGLVHEHEGKTVHIEKAPQPVPDEHHEEGHEEPNE